MPIGDITMISATSPAFTVFFARWLIKEPILKVDLINFIFVFFGLFLIVKPPFIFGMDGMYSNDPDTKWAVLGLILTATLLQSNVFVLLRVLKGIVMLLIPFKNLMQILHQTLTPYILYVVFLTF